MKMKILAVAVSLTVTGILLSLLGCSIENEKASSSPGTRTSHPATSEPLATPKPRKIIIGNLTDMTGPSANILGITDKALEDTVQYYNENNLIPGVELEVITYDGQLDPAKDIPGYEWLKGKGSDVIVTAVPDTPVTLKPRVDKEKIPLFAVSGCKEVLDPPGYVFVMGPIPEHQAYTMLNWISENDRDYRSLGPAKIGGASWPDGYSQSFMEGMKRYAETHPDQFQWTGGYLTNFTFTWGPEVESLRDCDYVFPCVMPIAFIKEYRNAECTAKFIGADVHTTFLHMLTQAELWDEIDGMLFIKSSLWWNEHGELIDLNKKILYESRPDEAEEMMQGGAAYEAVTTIFYPMLDMIGQTIEAVGPDDFNSESLYDFATHYSLTIDGIERSGFTETRRYGLTNFLIYRANAATKDITRASANWIPGLTEP